MIIVIKNQSPEKQVNNLISWIESQGLRVHVSQGEYNTVIGLIGDTTRIDAELVSGLEIVENVTKISEPFKKANRKFHPEDTVIEAGGVKIGGGNFCVIAGPCSVESEDQILEIATSVKKSGALMLRGGAYKPRTSPYDFQGLKAEGIDLLMHAKNLTGMPIVTEIININHLPLFENVDIIQVGARNMQNFELLKELGRINKPILLKRGLANTMKELLMSAEYIMAGGNEQIILCERGIRTFETFTRNTLDLSAVPLLKDLTHLPVVVDPSHSTGISKLVEPMALSAVACGADGLMIEVHNNPARALCDGAQSITLEQFKKLNGKVNKIISALKD